MSWKFWLNCLLIKTKSAAAQHSVCSCDLVAMHCVHPGWVSLQSIESWCISYLYIKRKFVVFQGRASRSIFLLVVPVGLRHCWAGAFNNLPYITGGEWFKTALQVKEHKNKILKDLNQIRLWEFKVLYLENQFLILRLLSVHLSMLAASPWGYPCDTTQDHFWFSMTLFWK